ncbi:hypothetical protein PVV74_03685 [Roseovarius sp. SK2]|uniref:hypothetical protein n=1 Tax=Roseovarius TaxID=74030 RepID=UPI00237B926A|nr:hypothetical protein [Roseovarius sp. SK2]MDD9724551.1 hypothetical protein [Roseovarius sp. SK2]
MRDFLAFAVMVFLTHSVAAQPAEDFASMPTTELIETAPTAHPSTLYRLSAQLLEDGNGLEAAKWMYAGQLRYRFLIESLGDAAAEERVLFSALNESVGRPVNEYIAGDPDEWIAAMQWALRWDTTHDNPLTSKTEFASELASVRSGLAALIDQVDANRERIRSGRSAAGLPNR